MNVQSEFILAFGVVYKLWHVSSVDTISFLCTLLYAGAEIEIFGILLDFCMTMTWQETFSIDFIR